MPAACLFQPEALILCPRQWDHTMLSADPPSFYQHVGFVRPIAATLREPAAMPLVPLEQVEKLEQLRVSHAGHRS